MQKTDLNVSPYYDDFTEGSNFHRVLFRPAFSVQARELTQMQSILQNQIERLGSHFFKEGAVIIPGQAGMDITYSYVKVIDKDVANGSHNVEDYRTSLVGKKLTSPATGIVAKVVGSAAKSGDDALTLFIKYEQSGTSSGADTSFTFANNEPLRADASIGYTPSGGAAATITAGTTVVTTEASNATGTGSSASVQKGVYFIRGHFVECATQTIVLDKYSNTPSYRIGFSVTESLSTPEEDTSLLDNATGSTNFAAKGAHRLKYDLTLTKKSVGTTDDADFVELMTVSNGVVQAKVRHTEYSVLEETLARRTFDESGNYIVRGFDIDMREHLDDGLNNGLFTNTDGVDGTGAGGDSSKIGITLSPGKAYVRGYEIETLAQTVVPLDKARSTNFIQNQATTFSAGNYVQVFNTFGMPDIDSFGSNIVPFSEVELRDKRLPVTHTTGSTLSANATAIDVDSTEGFPLSGGFFVQINDEIIQCSGLNSSTPATKIDVVNTGTTTPPFGRGWGGTAAASHVTNSTVYAWGLDISASPSSGAETGGLVGGKGKTIGVARTRAFEHGTGTESSVITGAYDRADRFQHYLFDVRMLSKLTIGKQNSSGSVSNLSATNFIHNGAKITGQTSGATGIVYIPPQDVQFTLTCTTPSSGSNVTTVDTGPLDVGMGISGTNIPANSFITGITNKTVFTINNAMSTNAANSMTIGNAVAATDGKKLNAGTTFHVIQTTGTFAAGEEIKSNISGDLDTTTYLAFDTNPQYFNFSDVHSVYGANQASAKPYIADIHPSDRKQLKGTITAAQDSTTVTGTNTGFLSDLKVGDLIEFQDAGSTPVIRTFEVKAIGTNQSLTTVETFPEAVSNSTITRVRSQLEEQEELVMISKLPKFAIKTLKPDELNNRVDTILKVRRQETLQLSGGAGSISLPSGQSFVAMNVDDYVIQVYTQDGTLGNPSGSNTTPMKYPDGTILSPSEDANAVCRITRTDQRLDINLANGYSTVLKVTFTVQTSTAQEKSKTLVPMETLAIPTASGGIYGTNYQDAEISLNKADIFKVRGVFMSSSGAAAAPTVTYRLGDGTSNITSDEQFQPGEKITGSNGAIARVISGGSIGSSTITASFCYLTTKKFTTGITLKSAQRTFSGDLNVTAVPTEASTDILSDFQIDNGMRDTYYDTGRISRKPSAQPPTGQLLIVYDYFTHGAGDYFSVDSYPVGTTTTSIDYSEIPLYSAQRVDPDTISPTGEYELRDSIDFRPKVADYVHNPAGTGSSTYGGITTGSETISPFSFKLRNFTGTNSSLVDVPKTDDTFVTSFNYYLPQNSALYLDSDGNFQTVSGAAAENPEKPPVIMDAMKLASFRLPPYTFTPLDVGVRKISHRRFTMKDIGAINQRVINLEYYTQLNMLEKDTRSYQIQDADGLDRFKNGFIVDNFTGHSVGDASHPDYQNSIDAANGILRPEFSHRALGLSESVTTDTERATAGYQKTGDLLTLPYTETVMVNQPYASRIENVNPFNVIAWIGSIDLDPASDIWRDTNRLPNLIVNREGNYDTFIARNGGSAINTVWNEWETFWTGEGETVGTGEFWNDTSWATARAQVPYRRVMEKTITPILEMDSRSGVRTEVVPRIDYESKGDRVVSVDILPFIRSKAVKFTARVFKPQTRLYAFFDNVDVNQYVTPDIPYVNIFTTLSAQVSSGSISNGSVTIGHNPTTKGFPTSGSITIGSTAGVNVLTYGSVTGTGFGQVNGTVTGTQSSGTTVYKTPAAGDPMVASLTGKCTGTFAIPDPNVSGNPAFKVGERVFKLTSSSNNGPLVGDTQTSGEATYYAKGLLDNIQETLIATRNAEMVVSTVADIQTRIVGTRPGDRQVGWWDPLAQSFLIDTEGGVFVTSVECYFNSKSETIPVQCQLRTMNNGYPSAEIIPFGTAILDPSEVSVSDDASAVTKFTFPSPVYLLQDIEYCFVIMANTQDYTMWLSHMGELDVGGSRMISDQPYAGVLFKSQNASTWTASQMEDLKFKINRASFSTTSGTVTLQNDAIPDRTLPSNPIIPIPGTKKVKILHPNHGMYSKTFNNVQLGNMSGSVSLTGGGSYDLSTAGSFTKSSLEEVGLDHYVVDLATGPSAAISATFNSAAASGGLGVSASENYMMDTAKIILQVLELSGTSITPSIRTTTGTSASRASGGTDGGTETSFTLTSFTNAQQVALNENLNFQDPAMVASSLNESQEMTGSKSFQLLTTLGTEKENISPVIDTQRMGVLTVQNRINKIDSPTDLHTAGTNSSSTNFSDLYKPSTAAEGDNNAAVYCTRKVTLANASSAIKVIFDAVRFDSSTIKVYYKALRADDTNQFEDIEWVYMNPDKTISESKAYTDFREYAYEASGLDGFIAFAVKIVMQGTKSTEVPQLKDFRAIALAL